MSRLVFWDLTDYNNTQMMEGEITVEHCLERYTGCLLGLAAGDAAGFAGSVKIPLLNGFTPTTSHTQIAAYACNGLLLGLTRGQLRGIMGPPVSYIAGAMKEWSALQTMEPGARKNCWISRMEGLSYRRCAEPQTLDILSSGTGTIEEPAGDLNTAGGMMASAAVGLFYHPERLRRRELQRLGAEAAVLTHGDPGAFLSGAALAHMISRLVWEETADMEKLSREAGAMVRRRFGRDYPQAEQLSRILRRARDLAKDSRISVREAMMALECRTAPQILAAAVYCCMTAGSFDAALAAAVDQDGDRTAAAAVTGAMYGAMAGERAIGKERLELLEPEAILRELAEDMFRGCPVGHNERLFDMEWDEKYVCPGM